MKFKEVVKMIKDSERKVDKVLKAARLERCEKATGVSLEKLQLILTHITLMMGMLLIFGFFFMFFYFAR